METTDILKMIGVGILLILLVIGVAIYLFKSATNFFTLADELEKEIKEDDNFESQLVSLMRLQEKSFHRATGTRIRELAKMIEVKYKVKIL